MGIQTTDHAEADAAGAIGTAEPIGPPEPAIASCATAAESRRPSCPVCSAPMEPEHAHHKCPACGYIEPCCGW